MFECIEMAADSIRVWFCHFRDRKLHLHSCQSHFIHKPLAVESLRPLMITDEATIEMGWNATFLSHENEWQGGCSTNALHVSLNISFEFDLDRCTNEKFDARRAVELLSPMFVAWASLCSLCLVVLLSIQFLLLCIFYNLHFIHFSLFLPDDVEDGLCLCVASDGCEWFLCVCERERKRERLQVRTYRIHDCISFSWNKLKRFNWAQEE